MNFIPDKVPTNVVLPEWIMEQSKTKEDMQRLVSQYINRCYQNYQVKKVSNGMAVCYRK